MRAAERAKIYRETKKHDPDFRKKEIERKRLQRLKKKETCNEDEKNREKGLSRKRQARYRENRKRKLEEHPEDIQPKQPIKKALTRKEHEKQKTYWKERKRLQRESMTAQKKRRVREKDRFRYVQRNLSTSKEDATVSLQTLKPTQSSPLLSMSAKKQRVHRLKKTFPKSPNKFAQVVAHIIMNATPRKRASLKKLGITNSPMKEKTKLENYTDAIRETMVTLKEKRQDRWLAVKRCIAMSLKSTKKARNFKKISKETGINYKFLRRYGKSSNIKDLDQLKRSKRVDCVDPEIIDKVQDHFTSSSSFVPDKKAVSKKTLESKKILDETVSVVYQKFKETNPDIKISQSKFSKLRPRNVQTTHHKKLYQSMCEHCTNPKLKRDALNKACERFGTLMCKIKDHSELIGISLCPKAEGAQYHLKKCIQRECEECGVQLLDAYFDPLINASINETVPWEYWSSVEYCQPGKKSSQRKTLLQTTSNVTELINAIKRDCNTLPSHLLNASWQKNCFDVLSKHVPAKSVVMHLDFSENYATFFQQEVSSAHWMKNLITVHPIVVYYNCPECSESAHPVMDVLVFLSDDNQHDHHAVQNFIQTAVRFLKEERDVSFDVMYEFTDGCSAQYKSRGPLVDISFGYSDFGVKRERFFFGSCHGKGPCDAAGGVVKTAARMAVIRGQAIITDARGMYACRKAKHTRKSKLSNICNHSRREFFLVEDINRDRPERSIKTSVKGTRKLHAVRCMTPGVICTRNLGCVCQSCLLGEENCTNDAYTNGWKVQPLNLQIPQVQRTWLQARGEQQGPRGARRCQRNAGRGHRGGGRGQKGVEPGHRGGGRTQRGERGQGGPGRGQRGAVRGRRGAGRGRRGVGRGRGRRGARQDEENLDNSSSSDPADEEVIEDSASDSDGNVSAKGTDICSDGNSDCEEEFKLQEVRDANPDENVSAKGTDICSDGNSDCEEEFKLQEVRDANPDQNVSAKRTDICSDGNSDCEEEFKLQEVRDANPDQNVSAKRTDICSDGNSDCEEEFKLQEVRYANPDESHAPTINFEWIDWTQELTSDIDWDHIADLATNMDTSFQASQAVEDLYLTKSHPHAVTLDTPAVAARIGTSGEIGDVQKDRSQPTSPAAEELDLTKSHPHAVTLSDTPAVAARIGTSGEIGDVQKDRSQPTSPAAEELDLTKSQPHAVTLDTPAVAARIGTSGEIGDVQKDRSQPTSPAAEELDLTKSHPHAVTLSDTPAVAARIGTSGEIGDVQKDRSQPTSPAAEELDLTKSHPHAVTLSDTPAVAARIGTSGEIGDVQKDRSQPTSPAAEELDLTKSHPHAVTLSDTPAVAARIGTSGEIGDVQKDRSQPTSPAAEELDLTKSHPHAVTLSDTPAVAARIGTSGEIGDVQKDRSQPTSPAAEELDLTKSHSHAVTLSDTPAVAARIGTSGEIGDVQKDRSQPTSPAAEELDLTKSQPHAVTLYNIGDFILTKVGMENIPGLIIQPPEDFFTASKQPITQSTNVWVQFLSKQKKKDAAGNIRWTLQEKPFFVLSTDVLRKLEDPSLSASGSRLYYAFSDI